MISAAIRGVTVPRGIPEAEDANDLIVYTARVSNPSNQENFDTGEKLLSYCMKKRHYSIFSMSNVVVEVNVPRDISRQILRHKSMDFQEFSQRYANAKDLGFVHREARKQHLTNRQMSIDLSGSPEDMLLAHRWKRAQDEILEVVQKHYDWAIASGVAKECARTILPEGLTMSRMYINGTLRSWYHYCSVRLRKGEVQKEHVEVAQQIYDLLIPEFPFMKEIEYELQK